MSSNWPRAGNKEKLNQSAAANAITTSAIPRNSRLASILPTKIMLGSTGASVMPSRQEFSRSDAKDRLKPSTPAKAIATHSTAGSSRSVSSRAVSKAKLKRKMMRSPKTHMEASVSRFLHSTRRSLTRMLQMIVRLFIAILPVGPRNSQALKRRDVQRAIISNATCLQGDQARSQRSSLLKVMRRKQESLALVRQVQQQVLQ